MPSKTICPGLPPGHRGRGIFSTDSSVCQDDKSHLPYSAPGSVQALTAALPLHSRIPQSLDSLSVFSFHKVCHPEQAALLPRSWSCRRQSLKESLLTSMVTAPTFKPCFNTSELIELNPALTPFRSLINYQT